MTSDALPSPDGVSQRQSRDEILRGLAAFFAESVHHVWSNDEIADCLTNMIGEPAALSGNAGAVEAAWSVEAGPVPIGNPADHMKWLARAVVMIQEELPHQEDRDVLGHAAHYIEKFAAAPSPAVLDPVTVEALIERLKIVGVSLAFDLKDESAATVRDAIEAIRALIGQPRNAEAVALTADELQHVKEAFTAFMPTSDLFTEISATILKKLASPSNPQEPVAWISPVGLEILKAGTEVTVRPVAGLFANEVALFRASPSNSHKSPPIADLAGSPSPRQDPE